MSWLIPMDSGKVSSTSTELIQECRHSAPGARLSAKLRTALERLPPAKRREVAARTRDGCAPLFIACKRGNLEIVEYLINVCNVDLEQRGQYEVADDRSVHTVTPLWCAAVSGKLEVLKCLVNNGADIDAGSDSGSTPVRSACFMTHLDIVRYLVKSGADIHKPNYNGGTCLINSVQSVPLCTFLLESGASVNATDMQSKTALHYAIQEHRTETTKLLLEHGADPFARSRSGDDALQTACLKGATHIFSLLRARVRYDDERIADALELLGSTLLDDFNDVTFAISKWREATALRHSQATYIEKRPAMPRRAAFRFAAEFRTEQELEAIATDMDLMRTQSLLVCERVLGARHKDTVFRLMYRGASYADAFRYQRCIDLWMWALEIRIEKDSLLFTDTCYSVQALVKLMLDACNGRLEGGPAPSLPSFADVLHCFRLLADKLPEARQILEIRPVYKKQSEMFDRTLKCVTHLIYLLLETAETPEQRQDTKDLVRRLVAGNMRSLYTGDTLLHLSVSRLNVIKSTYFTEDINAANMLIVSRGEDVLLKTSLTDRFETSSCSDALATIAPSIFPHMGVVRTLLDCGCDANVKNEAKSTALHVAAIPYNFSAELVQLLLTYGAHIDQPNRFGDLPINLICANRQNSIPLLRYLTLGCLAASVVVKHNVPYAAGQIPETLERFIQYHRP